MVSRSPGSPGPRLPRRVRGILNFYHRPGKWAAVEKKRLTVIVLGHVDHGKSTLVGRLLVEKGQVHPEEIERYATLGAEIGKESFKYAWVMDRSDESRRRKMRHFPLIAPNRSVSPPIVSALPRKRIPAGLKL